MFVLHHRVTGYALHQLQAAQRDGVCLLQNVKRIMIDLRGTRDDFVNLHSIRYMAPFRVQRLGQRRHHVSADTTTDQTRLCTPVARFCLCPALGFEAQ